MQNKILLNDLLLLTNSYCVINLHANKQLLNGEYVCSNIRIVVRMPTLTASYCDCLYMCCWAPGISLVFRSNHLLT